MATTSSEDKEFNRNSADFATALYQTCIEGQNNKNIMLSPLSIYTALGLALMGATGATAEEITKGLRLKAKNKNINSENFKKLLSVLNKNGDISIANKIYINSGYKIKTTFEEIARKQFKSECENLNFSQNEESATIINNWVEMQTNNRIKDLISSSMLDANTAMILVNAVYFQGSWKHTFNRYGTYPRDFWISKTICTEIEMMSIQLSIPSKRSDILKATAIQLPYKFGELFMMIILPDERDGLQYLETNLHKVNLLDYAESMKLVEFQEIAIPSFKIDFSVDLKEILMKMGMTTMFSDGDFSEILETPEPMNITKAIHKAFIDVNEEGTVAGAATGFKGEFMTEYDGPERIYFTAEHPFFYAIMNKTGVLFTGRFVKSEK